MPYIDATLDQINTALNEAQIAFLSYKNLKGKQKAKFLRAIADEIEALGQNLVQVAMRETNLPEARIVSERARTTGHCRMFAELVEEGSWVDARIDMAQPDRSPLPKPDIRKMSIPIGPIVVFGAANFPLAYSTAGGDTASALAAGCPVIVKAHPAHAETSELVAEAIKKAIEKTGMPTTVFQHLHGSGFEVGQALVKHPFTKGVGFTGSLAGGKALYDISLQRPEPIPVFAEMSSINPVILLPKTLEFHAAKWAELLATSITQGVGQFCTSPGLIIAIEGNGLTDFIQSLATKISNTPAGTMLHQGIADNYLKRLTQSINQSGITIEGQSFSVAEKNQGLPIVASISAREFLNNPLLSEEVFGPFSLIVKCKDFIEMNTVINHLHGQLTTSIFGSEDEFTSHSALFNTVTEKAGRLILNGVPTGVEVCPSMNHGGPYPATTDSRFTAVGTDAIKRFVRPISYQNFPDLLLPEELKNKNPLQIWRLVNSAWSKSIIN